MTLDNIQALLITMTFVVPGFIMQSAFSLFTVRRKEEKEVLLLRFLAFSTLNFLSCLWIIRLLLLRHYLDNRPFVALLCLFAVNFVSPLFLGIVIGALDQKQVLRRVFRHRWLRKLELVPMHPTPSAWEYKFGRLCAEIKAEAEGRWLRVRLKDGSQVLGFFGGYSFASTDNGERDLYLDFAYDSDASGQWTLRPRSDGILIKGSTVQWIEFLHHEASPPISETSLITERTEEKQNVRRQERFAGGEEGAPEPAGIPAEGAYPVACPDRVPEAARSADRHHAGSAANAAAQPAARPAASGQGREEAIIRSGLN